MGVSARTAGIQGVFLCLRLCSLPLYPNQLPCWEQHLYNTPTSRHHRRDCFNHKIKIEPGIPATPLSSVFSNFTTLVRDLIHV